MYDKLKERFWSRVLIVNDEDSCWPWQGGKFGEGGYGAFWTGCKNEGAHVVSFVLTNGSLTDAKPLVLHTCDFKPCVRPKHLYAGTDLENGEDRRLRGRMSRGDAHVLTKLSDSDLPTLRSLCASGVPQRSVARQFGISQTQVSRIVNNESRVS